MVGRYSFDKKRILRGTNLAETNITSNRSDQGISE